MQAQELPHPRCIILIEAGEESGSPDLPAYIEHLADRIGTPNLVICLDSGCGNYDQLWCTTSLRGNLTGTLDFRGCALGRRQRSGGIEFPGGTHSSEPYRRGGHW